MYTCTGKVYSILKLYCTQRSCNPLEFDRLADRDCSYLFQLEQGGGIPQFSHPRGNCNYPLKSKPYTPPSVWFIAVKTNMGGGGYNACC